MSETKKRTLSAKDSARIQCQTFDRERNMCGAPAIVVHEVHWDTGNTKGVSFFYHCAEHAENTRGD